MQALGNVPAQGQRGVYFVAIGGRREGVGLVPGNELGIQKQVQAGLVGSREIGVQQAALVALAGGVHRQRRAGELQLLDVGDVLSDQVLAG